jgi:hypothetical protein
MERGDRLLAVGGTHVFELPAPCKLIDAGDGSVKDLGWTGALALQAEHEGRAAIQCAAERLTLEVVSPVRLELEAVDVEVDRLPLALEPFRAQIRLYDSWGRELEVGAFTVFDWACSGVLEETTDPSAGEFGFCDTCFGRNSFRALRPGRGSIEARLGGIRGRLAVTAVS